MTSIKNNYIYILIEREFISLKSPIYKIGRTIQDHNKRMCGYPKGSSLILQMLCNDCIKVEADLIRQFKIKYKHRPDIGNEYFEGNINLMVKDVYEKTYNSFQKIKFFNPQPSIDFEFVLEEDDEDVDEDVDEEVEEEVDEKEKIKFDQQLKLVNDMLKILHLSHPCAEGEIVPDVFIDNFEVYYYSTVNIHSFLETFENILTGDEEGIITVINKILSLCGDCRLVKTTLHKYKLTNEINHITTSIVENVNVNDWYNDIQRYRYSYNK